MGPRSRNLGAVFAPLALVAALAGVLAAPLSADPSPEELASFAHAALAREAEAGVEDAYKWLSHATRGGEHAAPSERAARAYLEREWETLGPPRAGEPLLVPLRPDGAIVRVNLRPFRAAGGDREALLAAFLESARRFVPEPELFVAAWRSFGAVLAGEDGPMGRAAFGRLDRESEAAGWPVIHHGRSYAAAHVPAYRVLTGEAAAGLVRGLPEAR